MNEEQVVAAVEKGRIEWSTHALRRILQRGISRDAVKHIICRGEIIENHLEDKPFPSALFYGIWQDQPLHAVIAYDSTNQKVFLITAYRPDEEHFATDFKTRRI